jgi:ribosome maturation factor RimP
MYLDLIQLEDELDGFLYDFGYQAVDLKTAGMRGPGRVFRLFVERVDGDPVTIDECGSLAKQVVLFLEMKGVYNDQCSLEVSSAGVDRILKRSRDFEKYLGSEVKVRFFSGTKKESLVGRLKSFTDEVLVLDIEQPSGGKRLPGGAKDAGAGEAQALSIRRENLERVNLVPVLEI